MSIMDFISSNIWLVLAVIVSGGYLILPKLILGEGGKKRHRSSGSGAAY